MVSEIETIDLNRLRVFARVVEKSSFTDAARSLRSPKSSVSKSVSLLEATLGIQLLQRTSRSLRPTDAGSSLYEAVRPAISVIDDALAAAMTKGAQPRGRVRMSCPPDFDEIVAPYISTFCQRYPDVHVEASLTTRNVDLVGEGYDLALRGGELRDSTMVVRGTFDSDFGLFASPSYLKRKKPPRRLADLHDHVCIGVDARNGRATWRLAGREQTDPVTIACGVTVDDMRFAVRLATAGGGIALVPIVTAGAALAARRLVRVLPSFARSNVVLRLITPNKTLEPMAARLFREGLTDAVATAFGSKRRRTAPPRR